MSKSENSSIARTKGLMSLVSRTLIFISGIAIVIMVGISGYLVYHHNVTAPKKSAQNSEK